MSAFDVSESPGYLIRRAHQIVMAAFAEETGGEITPVQFGILAILMSGEPLDLITVAERMALDPSTCGTTVERLARKGWIERNADPLDRRRKLIRISQAGRKAFAQYRDAVGSVQQLVLEPLSPHERDAFLSSLRKLVRVKKSSSRSPAHLPGHEPT